MIDAKFNFTQPQDAAQQPQDTVTTTILFEEVSNNFKEVAFALYHLVSSLKRSLWSITRLVFLWTQRLTPWVGPWILKIILMLRQLALVLFRLFQGMSFKTKILIISLCTVILVIVRLKNQGTFQRYHKRYRRFCRHTINYYSSVQLKLKDSISRIFNLVREICGTLAPMLLIFLPLRLYLSPTAFRSVFNYGTCLVPLWYSIKSLIFYYTSPSMNLKRNQTQSTVELCENPPPPNESILSCLAPKGLLQTIRKSTASGPSTFPSSRIKRKTTACTTTYSEISDGLEKSTLHDACSSCSRSCFLDDAGYSLEDPLIAWLDYWVIAAVFDMSFWIPLFFSRLIFGRLRIPIQYAQFGYLSFQEPVSLEYVVFPKNLSAMSNSSAIARLLAKGVAGGLVVAYELFYFSILVFVISHKVEYLLYARLCLIQFLETTIFHITGIQVITRPSPHPSSSSRPWLATTPSHSRFQDRPSHPHETITSSGVIDTDYGTMSFNQNSRGLTGNFSLSTQTPEKSGLVQIVWGMIVPSLPRSFVWFIRLLSHMPQVLLLLLPPILVPIALFVVAILIPVISGLRSLESRSSDNCGYWLNYFVAKAVFEVVLRSARSFLLWKIVPLKSHLELLCITAIQICCLSPQYFAQYFFSRVQKGASLIRRRVSLPMSMAVADKNNKCKLSDQKKAHDPEKDKELERGAVLGPTFGPDHEFKPKEMSVLSPVSESLTTDNLKFESNDAQATDMGLEPESTLFNESDQEALEMTDKERESLASKEDKESWTVLSSEDGIEEGILNRWGSKATTAHPTPHSRLDGEVLGNVVRSKSTLAKRKIKKTFVPEATLRRSVSSTRRPDRDVNDECDEKHSSKEPVFRSSSSTTRNRKNAVASRKISAEDKAVTEDILQSARGLGGIPSRRSSANVKRSSTINNTKPPKRIRSSPLSGCVIPDLDVVNSSASEVCEGRRHAHKRSNNRLAQPRENVKQRMGV